MEFTGKVWKFGENVNTDVMAPGGLPPMPPEEYKKFCMRAIRPEFSKEVSKGDVIIAGSNFGCGSSRETAPRNLKALGISAVVAESFGRIFFRNCLAIGLPAVICEGVREAFRDGDMAHIDLERGHVKNLSTGVSLYTKPIPDSMMKILRAGGILEYLKRFETSS